MEETITVACIMDCPMIMIHAGKCYKALIDSGANISLICYSTHKNIGDSYKTPIQSPSCLTIFWKPRESGVPWKRRPMESIMP